MTQCRKTKYVFDDSRFHDNVKKKIYKWQILFYTKFESVGQLVKLYGTERTTL